MALVRRTCPASSRCSNRWKKWSKIILLCGWLEAIKTWKLRSYAEEPISILVESFELYSLNQHVITSIRREKIGKWWLVSDYWDFCGKRIGDAFVRTTGYRCWSHLFKRWLDFNTENNLSTIPLSHVGELNMLYVQRSISCDYIQ